MLWKNLKQKNRMTLTVIRHGQTTMNEKDLVCGITNASLTSLGIQEAKTASDKLKSELSNKGFMFDKIISSPLLRAKQTAEILSQGFNLEISYDERLTEQNYGIFEGKSRFNEDYLKIRSQFAVRYPEGESMLDLTQRVYPLLMELKNQNSYEHILLVTHGGIYRIILTYFMNMTNEEFANFRALNCEFKTFSILKQNKK